MFELSLVEEPKIKVASIIKFALRYLVTLTPAEGKISLYYWTGNKKALEDRNEELLDSYIEFCTNQLDVYFSAIKKRFREEWGADNTKVLSVTSINGFIMAFTRQLKENGIQNFEFYDEKFKNFEINFTKEAFIYSSSQYRKFSNQIIEEAFGLDIELV